MKKLSAKNNEQKNDFSASLRPFGTHNSRYLQGLRHILLRYRYGERQISANVVRQLKKASLLHRKSKKHLQYSYEG